MQVKSLSVERRASYDSEFPNMLVGTVELSSPQGSQIIRLSNRALASIFGVITAEVQATAINNAKQVTTGMANASSEPLLLAASMVEALL